jgi:hypothetical protein
MFLPAAKDAANHYTKELFGGFKQSGFLGDSFDAFKYSGFL